MGRSATVRSRCEMTTRVSATLPVCADRLAQHGIDIVCALAVRGQVVARVVVDRVDGGGIDEFLYLSSSRSSLLSRCRCPRP